MNAREAALQALMKVGKDGTFSNIAVKEVLAKHRELPAADKAFAARLVYGVISRERTLDYVLMKYSKIKKKKISAYILMILRIGIYQLMFMDKIPESAAVNESVKLAKRYGHKASSGFVNGILHAVIRGQQSLEYPKETSERLSVQYSFPIELVKRWVMELGEEQAEQLMEASNEDPPLVLRVNTLKTTPEKLINKLAANGIKAEVSEAYPLAITVSGFDIAASALYQNGLFTVQDTAAMLAGVALAPRPGETVIDLCAAPGGKTTHLAQMMENKGKILAFDIHEHKIDLIHKNAQRLGITVIQAQQADALEQQEALIGCADRVLADVPCSGLGILRRKPDIKWNWDPENDLPDVQEKILTNAASYVKAGGTLVYSTCTLNRAENEDVIERFLKEQPDFEKIQQKTYYPHLDKTDGFFICKLQKKGIHG